MRTLLLVMANAAALNVGVPSHFLFCASCVACYFDAQMFLNTKFDVLVGHLLPTLFVMTVSCELSPLTQPIVNERFFSTDVRRWLILVIDFVWQCGSLYVVFSVRHSQINNKPLPRLCQTQNSSSFSTFVCFCLLSHVLQQTYLLRVYEVIFRCMLFYIQAMLFYFFRYLYKHRGANQDYLVPHACLHILHVHDYVLFLTVLAFTILAVCMYFDTKQINNEHTTSKPPNPITDLEAELRAAKLATLES
jgi:hypothetical protein